MGTTEPLPDGWQKRQSKRHPDRFYYHNKETNETQWEPPNKTPNDKLHKAHNSNEVGKPSKPESSAKGRSSDEHRFKINAKSKNVKKSKTPAQDRLENLIVTNKTVAENLAKLIDSKSTTSNDKREKPIIHATKRSHTVTKRTTDRVESAKSNKQAIESDDSMVSVSLQYTKQHNAKEVEKTASDEIPALFPSKNLAEQRMTSLQQKLTNGAKKQNVDALCVFRETFGMGDSVQSSNSNADMDDAMDWESSDDAAYSFQQLESMVVEEELTDSFYIVPDTNVFLDSLTAIKNISEQDHKCSILIPFVVLQELDQLKRRRDESPVGLKSSCAIRYIYKQLKAKNPRMHGQKATEDKEHIIDVNSPDDKILNCCLQLKKQSKDVILVTNDINLSNKALMSEIEAITSTQCLERF